MQPITFRSWPFFLVLMAVVIFQSACTKEQIAPAKQEEAFVKYYGHVSDQDAADVVRTSDGGYLLLGATNSYKTSDNSTSERDVLLVKTDELGNEVWSHTYGLEDIGDYTYDEVGISIATIPDDGGYVLACNRTYINHSTGSPVTEKTKIVVYHVDIEGVVVLEEVLRDGASNTDFSEEVSDIAFHFDTLIGANTYFLTGNTTNINPIKPGGIKVTDERDMFIARIDENLQEMWLDGKYAYGFDGNDYGISVQVLDDSYVFIGTDQQSANGLKDNLRLVRYSFNGDLITTNWYGDDVYTLGGGYSALDPITQRISIFGHVVDGPNAGDALVLQVDYNFDPQTTFPDDATYGFRFYGAAQGNIGPDYYTYNTLAANGIAIISNTDGFVLSMTNTQIGAVDSDISILKVDRNLDVESGWPYIYGYQDPILGGTDGTLDQAGSVVLVEEVIEGTQQTELTGFAFTGTFGLGTNDMMGLVKLNTTGALQQ